LGEKNISLKGDVEQHYAQLYPSGRRDMADCVLFWGWERKRRQTGLNAIESF